MPQWQYKIDTIATADVGAIESHLNLLGKDGWELISVVYDDGDWTFFLKRPGFLTALTVHALLMLSGNLLLPVEAEYPKAGAGPAKNRVRTS